MISFVGTSIICVKTLNKMGDKVIKCNRKQFIYYIYTPSQSINDENLIQNIKMTCFGITRINSTTPPPSSECDKRDKLQKLSSILLVEMSA